MILKKLTLRNFLIHSDSEIEFNPVGITAIIGENGSGKSSIIEAIQFALFGSSSKGNKKDLIKWGKKEALVELEFENSLGLFKIARTISYNDSGSSMLCKYEKGQFIQYYQKNLNKEIPKIIGLTLKTFRTAAVVKQGEIEGLINKKPSEREKIMEELLGIQYYQRVIKQYSENKKYIERKLEELELQKVDIKQLKEKKSELQKDLSVVEEKIKSLEDDLKEKKNQFQSVLDILKDIEIAHNQIESKEKLINMLKADIEKLSKNLEEIQQIESKFEEVKKRYENFLSLKDKLNLISDIEKLQIQNLSLEEKINKLKEGIEFIDNFKSVAETFKKKENDYKNILNLIEISNKKQGQINQIKTIIEQLSQQLQQLEQEMKSIAETLKQNYYNKFQTLKQNPHMVEEYLNQSLIKSKELQKEKEEILNKVSAIGTEGKLEKEKIQKISALEGVCPTCNRPIQEHEKESLVKDIDEILKKKREEWQLLKNKEKEIEKELEKQEKIREKLQEFKQRFEIYKEKRNQISKFQENLKALTQGISNIDELKKQKEEIEKFLKENRTNYGIYETLIKQNINEQYEYSMRNLKDIKEKLSEKLSKLDITLDEINSFKEKIKRQIEEESEIEKIYFEYQQKIKEKSSLSSEIESKKRELANTESELKFLYDKVSSKNIEDLLKEKEKLNQEIENLENERLKLLESKSNINADIRYVEEEIKKAEKINKDIEELKNKVWKYDKVINTLTKINKLIKDNALNNLPKITEDIFNRFGFTNFSTLKLDEDYSILLYVNEVGVSEPVEVDALSGGQRIALALALRFAISKLLNYKTDFLILDEPGIFMDEKRRGELIQILGDLKEQNFVKQLIIVTHDEEVEDRADTIYKVDMGTVHQIL
ncbi:MAG: SMC family ATPase [Hydrogenothermaceae bacterium]